MHTIKLLGIHIAEDLSWMLNTTATIKIAQQRLHFLRVLRKKGREEAAVGILQGDH